MVINVLAYTTRRYSHNLSKLPGIVTYPIWDDSSRYKDYIQHITTYDFRTFAVDDLPFSIGFGEWRELPKEIREAIKSKRGSFSKLCKDAGGAKCLIKFYVGEDIGGIIADFLYGFKIVEFIKQGIYIKHIPYGTAHGH
jgi:hypothetical protein